LVWKSVTDGCLLVSSQGMIIEVVKSEVRGKAGGVVELECRFPPSDPAVSSTSPHVVEWVRQGLDIPVLIKFGSYAPRVHPKYEGKCRLTQAQALQLDDQGSYECRILLLNKPTDELRNGTWTQLSVTAPPVFSKAPPPILEVLIGRPLSLICVANGNPTPTITWLKDGIVIQQDGVLSVRAASMQSAGQYTCHASNSEGNVTRYDVLCFPLGPPVIVIPPKNTSLNMSLNALLQCQAVADPPNMTYVWQKGGDNVYHIESLKSRIKIMVDGTLLISSLIPEDSGRYTCIPTNGLLTPPTASANLTVMHPAKALEMPEETYLPTGKDGILTCPTAAQPPLLRVDWVKDGEPLDLSLYPGWTSTAEGSLLIATVNDDAAGVYTCTPYNSYGSMGSSAPTNVILQDPPSFSVTPEAQYKQEVGRTLLIPCRGNHDLTVKVTWSKVRFGQGIHEPNGSLLLQPVSKDHQGAWECRAANRVASVKARTLVFVLGTSPHAASSLSVSPGVNLPLSSRAVTMAQDWFSVPVLSSSGTSLQVTGLEPATEYQFSVLSHNKMGTGPFSEIVANPCRHGENTQTPPRKVPPPSTGPPVSLWADRGPAGVVLQWSPPEAQHPPITGFVLQSRAEQGEWFNLDEDISANSSEIVVPGLHKDCVYELRLLSRRGELLSEPSPSVNVSTVGMEIYPATSRLLEFVPEPLLAGVLGGVGFMCLALVLLLGSACVISHKRDRRCRNRRDGKDASHSGDSADTHFDELHHEYHHLFNKILKALSVHYINHSPLHGFGAPYVPPTTSIPISPPIEMICRGPDGRFMLPPYDHDALSVNSKKSVGYDLSLPASVRRSVSLRSEREDQKEPAFVLSVELPPCKQLEATPNQSYPTDPYHPHHNILDQKKSYDGFPDFSSLCSNSSLATIPHPSPSFPVLPHIRSGLGQPSTTASALVLQMEHERERGNLSHCLKLAQEREELERELRKYTLERKSTREARRGMEDVELQEGNVRREDGKYKSKTLPHRYPHSSKENLRLSSSPFSSSSLHWEDHRLVSPPTLTHLGVSHFTNQHPSLTKQTPLQPEEADSFSKDRFTLPHLSSKHQKHERMEAAPEGYDNSPQSTVLEMQTNDSYSEAWRRNNLSRGSLSTLSFHTNKYTERSNSALGSLPDSSKAEVVFPEPTDEDVCVEMSVDEPEFEICVEEQPTKPMLHHRIASHVQRGCSLTQKGQDVRRSKSLNSRDCFIRTPSSPQPPETDLWSRNRLKMLDSKQRSRSLDSRRRKERDFLTPDAWINSLSQENCSDASSNRPHSLVWEPRNSPPRKMSKSPGNPPSTSCNSSLLVDPERFTPNHTVPCEYEPRRGAWSVTKWPFDYQEAMREAGRYLEAMTSSSGCFPFDDNGTSDHEVDTRGYEGVPESGGSYSSYASSGRGSMEPANGRLSMCHISPTLITSPEMEEERQSFSEDTHSDRMEPSQR
uniref:Immunoglobulin superfamily, member 9a n=1 Tax=Sphaeramia orbicularis TaxID=375764 RepID=A0A673CB36_9TELE